MTIERAVVHIKQKPWGSTDLLPWSRASATAGPVGELWFQRADAASPDTALLLKLLFTTEPLSIQVHPDDALARSIGLANGKTEAWYILSATPDAKVALGLTQTISATELRSAIADGSIAERVQWQPARAGDVIFVPAGTIHAIGAGLVLAEIQQQSDATFRLFDYGRQRELHVDHAVAAAISGPAKPQPSSTQLSASRTALVVNPYFVLELVELAAGSLWTLDVPGEAWILAIGGSARIGSSDVSKGEAMFVEADRADIEPDSGGLKALLAYPGPNVNPDALKQQGEIDRNQALRPPLVLSAQEYSMLDNPAVQT